MEKVFYPEVKRIVLSTDGRIRVGRYTIGEWSKEYCEGTSHFRPSPYEGMTIYIASLNNGSHVRSFHKNELRYEIAGACAEGIAGEIDNE